MLRALIKKDAQLLSTYLRSSVAVTVLTYVAGWGMVSLLSQYQEERVRNWAAQTFQLLLGSSTFGFYATSFMAALMAGSIFTLERSDRSSEFLACLPPTRMQNLISKLTVALGTVLAMAAIHAAAYLVAIQLLPYVRKQGMFLPENDSVSAFGVVTFISVVVAMMGGALAVSAWAKSNGVPILFGLLTPLLIVSLIQTLAWVLEIESDLNTLRVRLTSSMFVVGLALGFCGCYWYLTRSEP